MMEMGDRAGCVSRSVDALLLGVRAAECVCRLLVYVLGELMLTNHLQQCLRR